MLDKAGIQMTYGEGSAGPHAVTSTSSGLSITYDANGNMESKTTSGADSSLFAQGFNHDAENRLVEVRTAQAETVDITFQPGWNFFSLPVIPEDNSITAVFPNFDQDFEQAAKFNPVSSTFEHYVGNGKFDEFDTLEYGTGYEVYCKASSPVTVSLTGKLPTQGLTQQLEPGWHLLTAICLADAPLSVVFGAILETFTQHTP